MGGGASGKLFGNEEGRSAKKVRKIRYVQEIREEEDESSDVDIMHVIRRWSVSGTSDNLLIFILR